MNAIEYQTVPFPPDEIFNAQRDRERLAREWYAAHPPTWERGELVGFDVRAWTAAIFDKWGRLTSLHGSRIRKCADA